MDTLAGDALGAGSVPANELRQVKQLLWTVIAEKLNPAEVDEVSLPNFSVSQPLLPQLFDRPTR